MILMCGLYILSVAVSLYKVVYMKKVLLIALAVIVVVVVLIACLSHPDV